MARKEAKRLTLLQLCVVRCVLAMDQVRPCEVQIMLHGVWGDLLKGYNLALPNVGGSMLGLERAGILKKKRAGGASRYSMTRKGRNSYDVTYEMVMAALQRDVALVEEEAAA